MPLGMSGDAKAFRSGTLPVCQAGVAGPSPSAFTSPSEAASTYMPTTQIGDAGVFRALKKAVEEAVNHLTP